MANYCFEGIDFKGYDLKIEKDSKVYSYPSVSGIVGQLDKSAALIPWAQRMQTEYLLANWDTVKNLEGHALSNFMDAAKKESTKTKEEAGQYGTNLHEILELAIKNQPIHSDAKDAVEFYLAIEGIIKRSASWQSEIPVVNTEKAYAGCIDLYDSKQSTLYDLKTSKGIYDTHYLQLAGYWNALESMGKKVDKAVILHWDKIELVLTETDCTAKVEKLRPAFDCLVDFYYMLKNRRVKNPRTQK